MHTEPTKAPISIPSHTPVSQWVLYLIGKKIPADRFLREMEEGVITIPDPITGKLKKTKTHSITIPDEATKSLFVETLGAKPDRIGRLISLLQAAATSGSTVRHIVMEFAEAVIKRLVVSFSEPLDILSFRREVSSWLGGFPKKPLKPADLKVLFLLLHFGWHRQLLDHGTALQLIASAVSVPVKPRPKQTQHAKPTPTPFEVLLAAEPTAPVLLSLVAYTDASKMETDGLSALIRSQAAEIARLTSETTSLNTATTGLEAEIITLQEQRTAAEVTIAELEKKMMDIRDGYQHKLDELRGRVRGMLQGQLTRWLQTALDASQSEPPWVQAIQERLEDALRLIEKEMQWLQPSA